MEGKGIKKIKNYRLIRQTGSGANGIVYESICDKTNKKFAIKSIPANLISEPQILNNFKNELKALHRINHPNIIKIYGVEKTPNNIYLILDWANGGNLQEYLYYYNNKFKSQLPESTVQFFIRQITKGLEYLHSNNIMHRDLKLENILLRFKHTGDKIKYNDVNIEEAEVLIADLGYAKLCSEEFNVTKSLCGTPIIMAPDIINIHNVNNNGKNLTYNSKVDLWSLGAITYHLIFGIPPFLAKNIDELFKEILRGKYILPKNVKISVETVTFLHGLLQFYPENRFSWVKINNHPFITKEVSEFHEFEVNSAKKNTSKQIEVDTKNCENLLFVMFKPRKFQEMETNYKSTNIKNIENEKIILDEEDNLNDCISKTKNSTFRSRVVVINDSSSLDNHHINLIIGKQENQNEELIKQENENELLKKDEYLIEESKENIQVCTNQNTSNDFNYIKEKGKNNLNSLEEFNKEKSFDESWEILSCDSIKEFEIEELEDNVKYISEIEIKDNWFV